MARDTHITTFRWNEVRDVLAGFLKDVESVKLVQPYPRFDRNRLDGAENEKRFRDEMIPDGDDIINTWVIHRASQTQELFTNKKYLVRAIASIHFWYELNDEEGTQLIFDDIVDEVIDLLRGHIRLEKLVEQQGPASLITSDHRYFAGRLCHHAQIDTLVQQPVTIVPKL